MVGQDLLAIVEFYWRPPELDDGAHDHYIAWYSHTQETVYDSRSFVTEVRDANGNTWWSTPDYNEHGQLLSYTDGSDLTTVNSFDPADRILTGRKVYANDPNAPVLQHSYTFDSIGNLTNRTDVLKNLSEDITYDHLNRLETAQVNSLAALTSTYDDWGNLQTRSDVTGSYGYTNGTPHQLTAAGGRYFAYDANGAIENIVDANQDAVGSISWTAFNKPYEMEVEGKRSRFGYDTANSRVTQTRQEWDEGQGTWLDKTRKTYVGTLFEQEQTFNEGSGAGPSAPQSWSIQSTRIYISTPSGVIGSHVDDNTAATPKHTFFHRDHLGSVIAESERVTDPATAGITKEFSYDAWGRNRDATDWDGALDVSTLDRTATDRGYTGHEMLDSLGLIHMNGRIYDATIGRFLSADPFVGNPSDINQYNRYSYVVNNPLSITDPSGFVLKKLFKKVSKFFKKYWKPIVTIALAAAIMWWAPFTGAYAAMLNGALAGGVSGAVGAALSGGDVFKGALMGAVAGAAFGAIGKHFGDGVDFLSQVHLKKIAAHGVTGEVMNQIQGGDFGYGFVSAGAAQFAAPGIDGIYQGNNDWGGIGARVAAAAVVGGTASELTGGTFENGAITGAFSRLFNDEGTKEKITEVKAALYSSKKLNVPEGYPA